MGKKGAIAVPSEKLRGVNRQEVKKGQNSTNPVKVWRSGKNDTSTVEESGINLVITFTTMREKRHRTVNYK